MKHRRKLFLILAPGLIVIIGITAMAVMAPVPIEQIQLTLLFGIAAVLMNVVPFGILSVIHSYRSRRKASVRDYSFYAGYISGLLAVLVAILLLLREISLGRPGAQFLPAGFVFLPSVTVPIMIISYVIGSAVEWSIRAVVGTRKHEGPRTRSWKYSVSCIILAGLIATFLLLLLSPRLPLHIGVIRPSDIHDAAEFGSTKQVERLFREGGDINARNNEDGETPLHVAAFHGREGVVEFLLTKGAQVNAKSNNGETPLHLAAWAGETDVLILLIRAGAELNSQDNFGDTPLHEAVHKGRKEAVRVLLENGADVNILDGAGQTPLWDAVYWGYKSLVKLFIERGAEVNLADKRGRTPLGIAREKRYKNIKDLLIEHGAKE